MGVEEDFKTFCSSLTIDNISHISVRYKQITGRLNLDFWGSCSDTDHRLYFGSYGRGTAIRGSSDLDMIFTLPRKYYQQYNAYTSNGQSNLLQDIKKSLKRTYPKTFIGGDGQVVVVRFVDKMRFEVVPAFISTDGSYTYPDAKKGGSWKRIDLKPEIATIQKMNKACNSNLKWLCRMTRAWKNKCEVHIGGLLIDTLAYNFISESRFRDTSFSFYDIMCLNFFAYLMNQKASQKSWYAPGSNQQVKRKGIFENKAKQCYGIALKAIDLEFKKREKISRRYWRMIYGNAYPV